LHIPHINTTRSCLDCISVLLKLPQILLKPYCKPANIVRSDGSVRHIQTLRDTGAMQSLLKTHTTVRIISLPTKPHCLKASQHRHKRVPLVQVHLRTDSINETVLCGLVNELPNGIDFLIGNDIWLKAHPLPDKVTEQAVTTCSTAHKTAKATQCTSYNDHLITVMNAKTSTTSVIGHSTNVKQQCAVNLSISDSHQSKKLSPAHSSNIYVKSSRRRTQRTCYMSQNCEKKTVPTVYISNTYSHDASCTEKVTDVKCENLSAQHNAQQHNVVTDCSKHFLKIQEKPSEMMRFVSNLALVTINHHTVLKRKKSSLEAPTSATVLLYHIVVCLLHILADLLKEIDRLEQQSS